MNAWFVLDLAIVVSVERGRCCLYTEWIVVGIVGTSL